MGFGHVAQVSQEFKILPQLPESYDYSHVTMPRVYDVLVYRTKTFYYIF